jgi:hypothetical protein
MVEIFRCDPPLTPRKTGGISGSRCHDRRGYVMGVQLDTVKKWTGRLREKSIQAGVSKA